jgi:hypothetical protein
MIDEQIAKIIDSANQIATSKNLWVAKRIKLANEIKQAAIELHLELNGPDVDIPTKVR